MFLDSFCDKGLYSTDAGLYPNWNCPAYACDHGACGSCGADPPSGTCGDSYECSAHGSCDAAGGCACAPGYLGFTCEYGRGVCPDDFACGDGVCDGGTCKCTPGFTGHDCSVALAKQSALPHSELVALTDLFHATGGDAWHINTGWLTADDPCAGGPKGLRSGFNGIICDEEGHVKELWLASNKLRNTPPASLALLPKLNFLNLADNSMSGFLDNHLSELLRHKDIRMTLVGNAFFCPLPGALRPLAGGCVDASMSLSRVAPAAALAFDSTLAVIHGNLRGGAATLAAYPELRVRLTRPDGKVVFLKIEGHEGSDGLRVLLPGSNSAENVSLALMHASEVVASGEVQFGYLECAAGQYKGVNVTTLAVACEVCPINTFCQNSRMFDCQAGAYTEGTGATSGDACIFDAEDSTAVIIGVLSALVGALVLAGGGFGAYKFRQQYKEAIRAKQQQHEMKVRRITSAVSSSTSVQFNVCLVPFNKFETYGKLIPHEEVRQRGDIVALDVYEHVLAFGAKFDTVFISHQWLGFSEPDPGNVHYNAILDGVRTLCSAFEIAPESLFLWLDYASIPQRNPLLKTLSISSLALYSSVMDVSRSNRDLPIFHGVASLAACSCARPHLGPVSRRQYFLVIAPECIHHDKGEGVDMETYQRRGWCRLEQWARMTTGGLQNMYLYDGIRMRAISDPKWYYDSIHVFQGDFTDPADKKSLVDTCIGLWAQTLIGKRGLDGSLDEKSEGSLKGSPSSPGTPASRSPVKLQRAPSEGADNIYQLIKANKTTVFPRDLFGDLIGLLESNLDTLVAALELEKGDSGSGQQEVIGLPDELKHLAETLPHNADIVMRRELASASQLHLLKRSATVKKLSLSSSLMLTQRAEAVMTSAASTATAAASTATAAATAVARKASTVITMAQTAAAGTLFWPSIEDDANEGTKFTTI